MAHSSCDSPLVPCTLLEKVQAFEDLQKRNFDDKGQQTMETVWKATSIQTKTTTKKKEKAIAEKKEAKEEETKTKKKTEKASEEKEKAKNKTKTKTP